MRLHLLIFIHIAILLKEVKQAFSIQKCDYETVLNNNCAKIIENQEENILLKKLYPWHVGIYRQKGNKVLNICGGTLISSSVIITAAHCVAEDITGALKNISEYLIIAGTEYREFNDIRDDNNRQIKQIQKVVLPSIYKGHQSGFAGDIAIIKVVGEFQLNAVVQPACVDITKNVPEIGQTVGWGLTVESRHPDKKLSLSFIPYLDLQQCSQMISNEFLKYLTEDKFCGVFSNGSSICQTDNGGGFLYPSSKKHWQIGGVISVGLISDGSCITKQFSAFIKLNSYLEEICQMVTL